MRPVSEATARVTGQSFKRKYIALGRIVNCWDEIIGADLAAKAQPVKIRYRKREKQEKPEATLDIATSMADATLLHYQKDLILERINQIFGERWITGIRFVSIPANTSPPRQPKTKRPLTGDEKNTLCDMLEAIEDTDIKERLGHLGEAILMEDRS